MQRIALLVLVLGGCASTEEEQEFVCPVCTNDIIGDVNDVALEDAEKRLSNCLDQRYVVERELAKIKEAKAKVDKKQKRKKK
jgi:hypothetical protein